MSDYRKDEFPNPRQVESGTKISAQYVVHSRRVEVHTDEWQHLAACRFGDGRPCNFSGSTKWTGDHYRFDIYQHRETGDYGLRFSHGGGDGWLIADSWERRSQSSMLRLIADMPDECQRWDCCSFIYHAFDRTQLAARSEEHDRLQAAFLAGRLKKRRQRGRVWMEVAPAVNIPAAVAH